jgi:hypothetical protein
MNHEWGACASNPATTCSQRKQRRTPPRDSGSAQTGRRQLGRGRDRPRLSRGDTSDFVGWTVVDFKTDREVEAMSVYIAQVKVYSEAVSAATSSPARGA